MKIVVSFAERFDGEAEDAAWLIESPSNRAWIHDHWSKLDPNSAIFRSDSDVSDILYDVFEHHPAWTEVMVEHAALTSEIESSLGLCASLNRTTDGFTINRL